MKKISTLIGAYTITENIRQLERIIISIVNIVRNYFSSNL
jgi:hypothetical protein